MRRFSLFALVFSAIVVLSGCLTSEYKEYKFEFKDKNSGTLTITYVNIFSEIYENEDPDSVLNSDYNELASNYMMGTELEDNFPDAKVVSKRLYEKDYQLNGELVLEFNDISQVNLFKYDKKAPYQFYLPSDETFFESNGTKPAEYMPVVFWDRKKTTLELTTSISEMNEYSKSLLSTWKANK